MVENEQNPSPEDLDVGEPVDQLAAQIAKGEPVGWGGPAWRRVRRIGMKAVAWLVIALLLVSAGAVMYALIS